MKHAELRAIVHNVANSLASGIGLLIGVYEMDVFGEASRSSKGFLIVDFLAGSVREEKVSQELSRAIALYREALAGLCQRAGGSVTELREAKAKYWTDSSGDRFTIEIEDSAGRRSITDYAGISGRRVKVLDSLGRIRPKARLR